MRRLIALLTFGLLFAACGAEPSPVLPEPGLDASVAAAPDAAERPAAPDATVVVAPDASEPPTPNLRVMTWNTENFFDDQDDPAKEDTVVSTEEMEAKVAALAKVIGAQSPDVVALQEVENETVLRKLADATGLPNIALVRSYDFRGINVAVATRLPITKTVSHLGEKFWAPDGSGPYRWARDCLEVHLAAPGGRELVVLVNHQTSQLDTSTGDQKRQAQAGRARSIANDLRSRAPSTAVIIAGDMNDEPSAASVGLYLDGGAFVDVATDIPEAERYTYVWQTPRRYDYLLPDSETATTRTAVTILHGEDVKAASDHSPLMADFLF
ncbi:MAG: endonuclease/exonuclease/phosphatase family protein [Myxococcales bacterium]